MTEARARRWFVLSLLAGSLGWAVAAGVLAGAPPGREPSLGMQWFTVAILPSIALAMMAHVTDLQGRLDDLERKEA